MLGVLVRVWLRWMEMYKKLKRKARICILSSLRSDCLFAYSKLLQYPPICFAWWSFPSESMSTMLLIRGMRRPIVVTSSIEGFMVFAL